MSLDHGRASAVAGGGRALEGASEAPYEGLPDRPKKDSPQRRSPEPVLGNVPRRGLGVSLLGWERRF
jgi:hypothetical protein